MLTAAVSWRAATNRAPRPTIVFVTVKLPLPMSPKASVTPRSTRAVPTASATFIGSHVAPGRSRSETTTVLGRRSSRSPHRQVTSTRMKTGGNWTVAPPGGVTHTRSASLPERPDFDALTRTEAFCSTPAPTEKVPDAGATLSPVPDTTETLHVADTPDPRRFCMPTVAGFDPPGGTVTAPLGLVNEMPGASPERNDGGAPPVPHAVSADVESPKVTVAPPVMSDSCSQGTDTGEPSTVRLVT